MSKKLTSHSIKLLGYGGEVVVVAVTDDPTSVKLTVNGQWVDAEDLRHLAKKFKKIAKALDKERE